MMEHTLGSFFTTQAMILGCLKYPIRSGEVPAMLNFEEPIVMLVVDFLIGLYAGQTRARQIAVSTAATAERWEMPFEEYQRLLEVKGVSWKVLLDRERTAILHLFQFGGAA